MTPPVSFRSGVLVLLILGMLGLLSLFDLFDGPGTARQERQARTPEWSTSARGMAKFVADARHHIEERYALKDTFIQINSSIKLALFGHSDTANVSLGQDGFLFLNSDQTIQGAQGLNRLSEPDSRAWRAQFQALSAQFETAGLPFVFVMAPNKHSVYPDKLPAWVGPNAQTDKRTQDILALARSTLDPAPIDATSLLRAYRKEHPDQHLYHLTDTHWNELGASLALQEALAAYLPAPAQPIDVAFGTAPRSGDLARMLGQQHALQEEAPKLQATSDWHCTDTKGTRLKIETIDPLMPRRFDCKAPNALDQTLVVFTDSFGVPVIPYLASSFARVAFIWSDVANPQQAKDLGADLVLQIIVERKFQDKAPHEIFPK